MKESGPTTSDYGSHEVTAIEKINRDGKEWWDIVWKTIGVPLGEWMMRAERVQECIEVELDGGVIGTEYRTWGIFGGPMAYG
jgi:hypothetical protein